MKITFFRLLKKLNASFHLRSISSRISAEMAGKARLDGTFFIADQILLRLTLINTVKFFGALDKFRRSGNREGSEFRVVRQNFGVAPERH
jgi:hypothetical protein